MDDIFNKIADKRKKSQDIAILNYENTTGTSQSEIVNTLNKFLSEIGSTINNDLKKVVPSNTTALNSNSNGFKLQPDVVSRILNDLPTKKMVESLKYQLS